MNKAEKFLLDITRQFINNTDIDYSTLNQVEMAELHTKACQHRIFHLFCESVLDKLKSDESSYYYQLMILLNLEKRMRKIHQNEIIKISEKLNENGIPYIFIKGILQEQLLYDGKPLRDTGDIDLIVKSQDLNRAYRVLKSLGYLQPENEGDEIHSTARHYWEVSLFNENYNITLELKTGSSAIRKNFEKLFDHTMLIDLEGTPVCTLNPPATLVHIFANAHEANEARGACKATTIRDYFESMLILRKIGFSQESIEIAEMLESRHKIYEVLQSLDDLYGLTQEEKEYAKNFDLSLCQYPFEIDGWSNKSQDMNCALLFDPFKPHAESRLFDSDYAFFHYLQRLKNALFNRPQYKHQHHILQKSGEIKSFSYEARKGIDFEVFWEKDFHFRVKIDKKEFTETELNSISIGLKWYERDIMSPYVRSSISIRVKKAIENPNDFAKIRCQNFYKGIVYKQEVERINEAYNAQFKIPLHTTEESGFLYVSATLPFEMLPVDFITPTLICEVLAGVSGYFYGEETHAFSFNFYS